MAVAIALVTPSFQAERYIKECVSSVLDQDYPNLQYVVMDGGSSDGSVDIIKSFADRLHYWTSSPDEGPYQAIAAGFAKTDAEIMGWVNADDILLPWTLRIVGGVFTDCPNVEWVTTETPMQISTDGLPYILWHLPGFTKRGFRSRENCGGGNGGPRSMGSCIQQESTFWRRSLWEKAGGRFESQIKIAGDFELWDRFFDHALLYSINIPLGAFRRHGGQRSALHWEQYKKECNAVLSRHGNNPLDEAAYLSRHARMMGFPLGNEPNVERVPIVRRNASGRFKSGLY